MNTPEEHWWTVRAGEYVLGTLRGKDLELFERILAHDTTVQALVADWEIRLNHLNNDAPQQTLKSDLLPGLLQRIRECDNNAVCDLPSEHAAQTTGSVPLGARSAKPKTTTYKSRLWPTLTGLATAASLVLGMLLYQRTTTSPLPLTVDGLAVVLSDDSGEPFFLVETDYGNLRVRVTALAPPSLADTQDFQLWQALPDLSGVRPVALLPRTPGETKIVNVGSLIDNSELFGVSIEPVGIEPTDQGPTGPVVAHGDFLPTRSALNK